VTSPTPGGSGTAIRAWAVCLAVASVGGVAALIAYGESVSEPQTLMGAGLRLIVLLLPFVSYLAVVLLAGRLIRGLAPQDARLRRARLLCCLGPVGAAWSVFLLSEPTTPPGPDPV
jgi:hypothetical protein